MLFGSLVLNVEESLSRMGDLLIRLSIGTYLLPPLHMLYGSLVLNVEESLSEMGDLFVFCIGTYLLPPLHVLGGSLVLNVEERLSRMGDLPMDLRIVELVPHNVMILRIQPCTKKDLH